MIRLLRPIFRALPKMPPVRHLSTGFKKLSSEQMSVLKTVFPGPGRLISIVAKADHTQVDVLDDTKWQRTDFGFEIDSLRKECGVLEVHFPLVKQFVECGAGERKKEDGEEKRRDKRDRERNESNRTFGYRIERC